MNKRGFTLVEVIVASLVLSIAVGAFFISFLTARESTGSAGRKSIAVYLARDSIDDLRNAVDADYWPPNPEAGNPRGDLSAGGHASDISGTYLGYQFGGTRNYDITDIDVPGGGIAVDYKLITVTVDWVEP